MTDSDNIKPAYWGFGQQKAFRLMDEVRKEDEQKGYLSVFYRGVENEFKCRFYEEMCRAQNKPTVIARRTSMYSCISFSAKTCGVNIATIDIINFIGPILDKFRNVAWKYHVPSNNDAYLPMEVLRNEGVWRIMRIPIHDEESAVRNGLEAVEEAIKVLRLKDMVGLGR